MYKLYGYTLTVYTRYAKRTLLNVSVTILAQFKLHMCVGICIYESELCCRVGQFFRI